MNRPHTTIILAMSADGKIADAARSPARFSSAADQAHLEKRIASTDGVLFGAGTLRAYGTTRSLSDPKLLQERQKQGLPPQPVQIVCSASATLDPQWRFFQQAVPRWLLTTAEGAEGWQASRTEGFDRILVADADRGEIDWHDAFNQLSQLGLERLGILGGGELIASLLAVDFIDEFWLTICPVLVGGATAPTPVEGEGFSSPQLPHLELLELERVEQEIFLHYKRQRS
jgi:5-amino-6-(5-phosphoribosylamino)uracil reductase